MRYLSYKRTRPFGASSDMLLKKSIASPEHPSCDNGTGGNVLLCAPSPHVGRPVWPGQFNKRKTGAGA